MESSSDIRRLRFTASCTPLDVGSWWSSRRRTARFARLALVARDDDDDDGVDAWGLRLSRGIRGLWRRITKEKRRILRSATTRRSDGPYDPCTYAQNFDEGSAWAEPENLARSFSARFAVPSRKMEGLW
ncbi:hypothetical protein Cni_G05736 [Canna indica]|uniref:Uncharacterized protein n=1 Tax=Canna indica TaxID=4628 RepID=A0AAQ3Q423_9LILI|nr:hypothetical protein Cni_G05736 [Canna indica]